MSAICQPPINTIATTQALTAHTSNVSNPHSVTAAQVGAYNTTQADTLLAAKATRVGDNTLSGAQTIITPTGTSPSVYLPTHGAGGGFVMPFRVDSNQTSVGYFALGLAETIQSGPINNQVYSWGHNACRFSNEVDSAQWIATDTLEAGFLNGANRIQTEHYFQYQGPVNSDGAGGRVIYRPWSTAIDTETSDVSTALFANSNLTIAVGSDGNDAWLLVNRNRSTGDRPAIIPVAAEQTSPVLNVQGKTSAVTFASLTAAGRWRVTGLDIIGTSFSLDSSGLSLAGGSLSLDALTASSVAITDAGTFTNNGVAGRFDATEQASGTLNFTFAGSISDDSVGGALVFAGGLGATTGGGLTFIGGHGTDGAGGDLSFTGGPAGTSAGYAGGAINFTGADGSNGVSSVGGAGSAMTLTCGSGGTGTSSGVGGAGGSFTIAAGSGGAGSASTAAGNGGSILISAKPAGSNGGGGAGTNGSISLRYNTTVRFKIDSVGLGFFNVTPVTKQTDGAALTNSVTVGGTTNTIADFTDLVIYANDSAAIRNDIYQIARKLKIIGDALRTYGLLS